ncbi:MAG: sel1 repeat family protein [Nitrospiraceae bacterium]|nr:MAG: sel1 repeat family protein [Nitrospiraceae bacterium]
MSKCSGITCLCRGQIQFTVVFLIFILLYLFGMFHSQAQACGWWGDGQDDDGDDVIVVDSDGNPVPDEESSLDDPVEQTRIGNRFRRGESSSRDYREAVQWYRKAAEQGFAGAQNNLANMYEQGHGVAQDYSEAAKWYVKAAEQENSNAQHSLGRMYLEGRGVPRDFLEAIRWFQKAAEKRHPMAFRDLGTMYWKGLGVSKDTVLAYMWWKLGAEYGDEESEKLQDMIAEKMVPGQIREAKKMAQEWMQGKK